MKFVFRVQMELRDVATDVETPDGSSGEEEVEEEVSKSSATRCLI
jgi:hypothetical protein